MYRIETYQGSEVVILQRMEVVFVQRVGDIPCGPIGKRDSSREATHVLRNDTLFTVWRIHRPIPVGKANSVCNIQGLITGFADGILIGDVDRAIMENLLEEREIRSVPGAEHARPMRTISHHLMTSCPVHIVPLLEWHSVYP